MEESTFTVKVIYLVDGQQVEQTETFEYDPETSGIVAEIEYVAEAQNGGPVMRPKTPRI